MTQPHEPTPEFARFLEWQTATSVRRAKRFGEEARATPKAAAPGGRILRFARACAIVLASVGVGASGVIAAERIQDSKVARQLLARNDVEVVLAEERLSAADARLERTKLLFERQFVSTAELAKVEVQRERLSAQLSKLRLDGDEVELALRAPSDSLDAAVVAGRDFVSERLQLSLDSAKFDLERSKEGLERTKTLFDRGYVSKRELSVHALDAGRIDIEASRLTDHLALRSEYLIGGVDSAEVVRRGHLVDLDARVALLSAQRATVEARLKLIESQMAQGLVSSGEVDAVRAEVSRIDGELKLCEIERNLPSAK